MSLPLAVAVWIGVFVLFLCLLIVVTSWRVRLIWRSVPKQHLSIKAGIFGKQGPSVTVYDGHALEKSKSKKTGELKKVKVRRTPSPHFVLKAFDCLISASSKLHVEKADIRAEFGFKDPADTGHIYGLLAPLNHVISSPNPIVFTAYPNFSAQCLRGNADICVRFRPILLLGSIFGFVWQTKGLRR